MHISEHFCMCLHVHKHFPEDLTEANNSDLQRVAEKRMEEWEVDFHFLFHILVFMKIFISVTIIINIVKII